MAGKIYLFARFTTVQFLNEHAVLRRRKWEEMKGREREWLERKEVVRKGVWKKLVGVSTGGGGRLGRRLFRLTSRAKADENDLAREWLGTEE